MQDPNYRLAQCAQSSPLHQTRALGYRGDSRDGAGNMAVRPKNVADRDKHHGGDCERRQHQSRLHRPLDALLAQSSRRERGHDPTADHGHQCQYNVDPYVQGVVRHDRVLANECHVKNKIREPQHPEDYEQYRIAIARAKQGARDEKCEHW